MNIDEKSGPDDPTPTPRPPRPAPSPFAARLVRRRLALGLSQAEVGRRMVPPTAQPAVAKYEAARRPPGPGVVARLAAALGCDPADLDPSREPAARLALVPVWEVRNPNPARQTRRHVRLVGWAARDAEARDVLAGLGYGDGVDQAGVGGLVRRAAEAGVDVLLVGSLGEGEVG